ncbi:MAG: hypothetical protein N2V75_12520 [Methanophagales archaeon]|nr:hypothetical protein [Methanophagales archaeon]
MVENQFKEEVNRLFNRGGQSNAFDYDSFNWGCLRYMLELWIFLNRLSKQGIRTIRDFFNTSLIWLSGNEELRKYDGQDYTAASMLSFFLFAKLARMKIEEGLDFVYGADGVREGAHKRDSNKVQGADGRGFQSPFW